MNITDYIFLKRYSLAKNGALDAYKTAILNQRMDESALNELVWEKTKKLVSHAYANVSWYKDKFDELGLHPFDITKPEYFGQIPILKRHEIINNFDKFISKGVTSKNLKFITTGGSSGKPLKIGVSKRRIREIQKWQMFDWWNVPLNANMASIYRGVPVNGLKKLALSFINWPQKIIRLDAAKITSHNIRQFIHQYRKVRPKLIHGYVGALDALADYILENNIKFDFKPNSIWCTAAPISVVQENKISKAFNAPVCDQYGCSELYFVSAECSHKRGLHIFSDSVKVEIVDYRGQTVRNDLYGNIILTNLDEYAFPLIRYENGDRGRILDDKCSCGMTLPLMDKVKGRISDNINLPNSVVLSGEYLTTIFDNHTDYVKQFQIIQKKDLSLKIKVKLSNSNYTDLIKKFLERELGEKINNQVGYTIDFVDEIFSDKGKLRFIIKE
ncbi:hypothetical protein OA405_00770 [Bacteroidota bacterium]|nr:hypothetical protein [Bacteroidota bacterium]